MANGRGERAKIAAGILKRCGWYWGSHGCDRKEGHVPPCLCVCGMRGPTSEQLAEGTDFHRFRMDRN